MLTPIAFELFETIIDEVGTGEADRNTKSRWLNLAIRDFIDDRLDPKLDQKGYSFQSDNRVRMEFKELYVPPATLNKSAARIFDYPADFKYPGTLRFTSSSHTSQVGCNIYSPNKAADAERDSFIDKGFEPHAEMTTEGFYYTSGLDDGTDITAATLSYIKKPTEVSQGQTLVAAAIAIATGDIVYVETGQMSYNSVTRNVGDSFLIVSGGGVITGSGTGSVITSSELNDDSMRECIRKACYMYLVSMDQLEQAKAIMMHEANS